MTPTQLKVLQQAVDDGGDVVLSGIDTHRGWGQRERTAAYCLHCEGLGIYEEMIPYSPSKFTINQAGREELIRLQNFQK